MNQQIHDTQAAYKKPEGFLGSSFHQNIDLVSAHDVGMDSEGVDHFGDLTCMWPLTHVVAYAHNSRR